MKTLFLNAIWMVLIIIVGCGGDDNIEQPKTLKSQIVGHWLCHGTEDSCEGSQPCSEKGLTFNSNGTGVVIYTNNNRDSFNWSISGTTLFFVEEIDQSDDVEQTELNIDDAAKVMTFSGISSESSSSSVSGGTSQQQTITCEYVTTYQKVSGI